MGSDSDLPIMKEAAKVLDIFGVHYEVGIRVTVYVLSYPLWLSITSSLTQAHDLRDRCT